MNNGSARLAHMKPNWCIDLVDQELTTLFKNRLDIDWLMIYHDHSPSNLFSLSLWLRFLFTPMDNGWASSIFVVFDFA